MGFCFGVRSSEREFGEGVKTSQGESGEATWSPFRGGCLFSRVKYTRASTLVGFFRLFFHFRIALWIIARSFRESYSDYCAGSDPPKGFRRWLGNEASQNEYSTLISKDLFSAKDLGRQITYLAIRLRAVSYRAESHPGKMCDKFCSRKRAMENFPISRSNFQSSTLSISSTPSLLYRFYTSSIHLQYIFHTCSIHLPYRFHTSSIPLSYIFNSSSTSS